MSNIGINITAVRTEDEGPEFRVGTVMRVDDQDTGGTREYIYVNVSEAVTGLGYVCVINSALIAELADPTSTAPGAGAGLRVGAAQAAIEADGFGWLQIYGKGSVRTLASAAVGTALYCTATPGALDDAASTGLEHIVGVALGTASAGAAETNADAYFNYPYVGDTA